MDYLYHGKDGQLPFYTVVPYNQICIQTSRDDAINYIESTTCQTDNDSPLFLADFGTGDGLMAMEIFKDVVDALKRQNPNRGVVVILNDVADSNLDQINQSIKGSKLQEVPDVTVLVSVKDFFNDCFPGGYIDFSMSHITLQHVR